MKSTKPREVAGAIEDVREFWNVEACGASFIKDYEDKRDFYQKYRDFRYRNLWFIPLLVPFREAKGRSVLEIGCGLGTDGAMFARQGASYTGVDLTQTAVDAAREHFEVLGLKGNFQPENAEKLSFPDGTFDIVYSYGVLHHTPDPRKAIREVHRVLKPHGRAIVMLYHKHSLNYHVRILGYMRLRVLLRILSRLGRWRTDRERLARLDMLKLRGNDAENLWDAHYRNFLEEGWKYLKPDRFVHACADGPACPHAYVFSKSDARSAFSMFGDVEMKVAHLPLRQYLGKWFPFWMERILAARIGWALMVYAEK